VSQQGDHISCELFLAKESASRFFHDKSSACRFFHDRSVCGTGVLCLSRSTFAEFLRENRGITSCRCNRRESQPQNFSRSALAKFFTARCATRCAQGDHCFRRDSQIAAPITHGQQRTGGLAEFPKSPYRTALERGYRRGLGVQPVRRAAAVPVQDFRPIYSVSPQT
jgi:hypothetical protein